MALRRLLAAAAAIAVAGCAVPPAPPSPDPIASGFRSEGRLEGEASTAQTAFCVSKEVPLSFVGLPSDGAAVRPLPGSVAFGAPDYALTLRQTDGGTTWLRQVADDGTPAAAAIAERLDRALAGCAAVQGGPR